MGQGTTRRGMLKGAAALGCSAAASPFLTTMTFAQAPWDARLVVVILRGAMDGLDVLRPMGDPAYRALRAPLLSPPGIDLDGYWALHPALAPLAPLWRQGELSFAHAVSTPYRDKRSHFDGQDILEAGTGPDVAPAAARDGWLNRMLAGVPGLTGDTAFAIGRDRMKVLAGGAPVAQWSPEAELPVPPATLQLLERIYHHDPLFRDAAAEAISLDALTRGGEDGGGARSRPGSAAALAEFAAARLREDTRIAAFSLPGWDTHANQGPALTRALGALSDTLLALRRGLGGDWARTVVLAMTEFGRTAALNGTGGTDHGTGGAMLMAGGALKGGQVLGRWPGLAEADLYDRRDLMPTGDVRAPAAWAMRGLFGLDRATLERVVFPGLEMGSDPGLLA